MKGAVGMPDWWTCAYFQVQAEWAITPNLSGAIEAVNFQVSGVFAR